MNIEKGVQHQDNGSDSNHQKILELADKIEDKKKDWNDRISLLASEMIQKIERYDQVQVNLFSIRQKLVDEKYQWLNTYSKINRILKKKMEEEQHNLEYNTDHRWKTQDQRKTIINSSLANITLKMELIKNQIEFYTECITNVQNMIYGVQHRIEIEKIKRQ